MTKDGRRRTDSDLAEAPGRRSLVAHPGVPLFHFKTYRCMRSSFCVVRSGKRRLRQSLQDLFFLRVRFLLSDDVSLRMDGISPESLKLYEWASATRSWVAEVDGALTDAGDHHDHIVGASAEASLQRSATEARARP